MFETIEGTIIGTGVYIFIAWLLFYLIDKEWEQDEK